MNEYLLGRQPIFDLYRNVYGYELLHRLPGAEGAQVEDGDRISAEMLLVATLEKGIARIGAGRRAFINVTERLLLEPGIEALPSNGIVLEVLETVGVNSFLLRRLKTLRDCGFGIALDDYIPLESRNPLIEYADIVKIDVLAHDASSLERHVAEIKKYGVRLLAEKVETDEMYQQVLDLGFDLFQGYFFARPTIYEGGRIAPNHFILLELISRINDPDITPHEFGQVIRGDVSMCVTVLRLANSVHVAAQHTVDSLERALVILGLQTVRNWVTLLAVARMGGSPTELLGLLLVRARTCELMAIAASRINPSAYFTVGLLSRIDVVLRVDMNQVLESMGLSIDQKAALLTGQGDYGAALECVVGMERGQVVPRGFLSLTTSEIRECYLNSLEWADALSPHAV